MSVQAKKTVKARKATFLTLERKNSLFGYIFCLPIIIGLAFVYIPVLVQSIIYSFSDINIVKNKGFVTTWTGWANYKQALFVEDGFLRTVIESVTALLPQIFVILIFAFFMANVLNQKFHGRTIARVIFFIPVIISTGIMNQFDAASSMLDTYSSGEKLEMGGGSGTAGANIFNYSQLREVISSTLNNATLSGIVLGAIVLLCVVLGWL